MPKLADYKRCAAEGMTSREIAEKYGLSRQYVAKVARQNGLTLGGKRPLITREILDRAIEMQASGMTLRAIGAELGFARVSISVALSRARNGEFGKGWRTKERAPNPEPTAATDWRVPATKSLTVPVGPSGGASAGRAAAFHSPARPKRRVVTPEQVAAAIVLKASGQSWEAIGRVLGYRGDVVKVAVARHRTALADAAPEPEPEEEGEEDVPEFVAPRRCVVESLMQKLGISRRAAIEEAVSDRRAAIRKAEARKAESAAAHLPVRRISAGPYRMGEGA